MLRLLVPCKMVLTLKRLVALVALKRPLVEMDAVDVPLKLGLPLEYLVALRALELVLGGLCFVELIGDFWVLNDVLQLVRNKECLLVGAMINL